MTDEPHVLFEKRGAAGLITLNRPKALNALTHGMCLSMTMQLKAWAVQDDVKVIVIQGSGERAFCAGGDIRSLYESGVNKTPYALNFYRDEYVLNALIKHSHKLPQELYKSLTWDRGTEMHAHKKFTLATDIQVYFCDPQSPWQRGSNENTNGLLRQYLPKGIDISDISQAKLNAIARQLNERPRKTLGFQTPAEMFSQCVALTS